MRTTAQLIKTMSEHVSREDAAKLLKAMEEEGSVVKVDKELWVLTPEFRAEFGEAIRDMYWGE